MWKRLLEWIHSILHKTEKKPEVPLSEPSPPESFDHAPIPPLSSDLALQAPLWEDWQEDLCLALKAGDVVHAWMPEADRNGHTIPEGHDHRPYLVVDRQGMDLLAYAMSSGTHVQKLPYLAQFPVGTADGSYKLYSRIMLNKASRLSCDLLMERMDPLPPLWIPHVQRRIAVHNYWDPEHPLPGFSSRPAFLAGDVVRAQEAFWLLLGQEKGRWKGVKLEKEPFAGCLRVPMHGRKWYGSLENQGLLQPGTMELVWFFPMEKVKDLLAKFTPQPVKKEPEKKSGKKKKKTPYLPCRFEMEPGAVIPGWNEDQEFIYLFSLKDRRYGVQLDWYHEPPVLFIRLPDSLPEPVSICSPKEMEDYLDLASHQAAHWQFAISQCRKRFAALYQQEDEESCSSLPQTENLEPASADIPL